MSGKNNEQTPSIVVDDIDGNDDEAKRGNDNNNAEAKTTSGAKGASASEHGGVRKKKIKPIPGQIPMPSQQVGKLTAAYNNLLKLQKARKLENIAYDALEDAERELLIVREALEAIQPEDELQQSFKDSWIAKNVQRKEAYIVQLKQAMLEAKAEEQKDESDSSSEASAQEQQAAAEEEALLLLQQEQMLRRQTLRRRQREEELLEQAERDKLQLRLLEVRSRASSRANSRASSRASDYGEERVRQQLNFNAATNEPPLAPRLRQPIQGWLEQTEQAGTQHAQTCGEGRRQIGASENSELMRQMLLAQTKVPVFRGDQLEYLWFRQSFEMQVERVTSDSVQRLYWLLKCLDGEPLKLVRGCQLATDPKEGFLRAKTLLNERYGHPIRQTLAYKTKLLSWPGVKTSTDLTNFCVHLQQCRQMMLGGIEMADLDSSSTLFSLASKLPERLQTSWQTRVVDIESKEQRMVDFKDFVKYVQRQESAKTHPIFGKLVGDKKEGASNISKARAFVTDGISERMESAEDTTTEQQEEAVLQTGAVRKDFGRPREEANKPNAFKAPCLFCNEEHAASKCRAANLTSEDKRAKLRGLCFACLKPGHAARFCRFKLKCDVCGDLHPTVLHQSKGEEERTKNEASPGTDETPIKEKNFFTHGQNGYAMATVRVKVWTKDRTNCLTLTALLDLASSATFVTQDVTTALRAPTRSVSLQLTTMSGEEEKPTSFLQGLKVSDVDENNVFSIGLAYVVQKMPDAGVAISPEDLEKWPHLQGISAYTGGGPIHMLIGQNVLGAHTPDDVRRGDDYEPFAMKTKLGWTVMGPLQSQSGLPKTHKALTNVTRVNVRNIEDQLQKLYFTEFNGAYEFDKKGPSQEDKLWRELVERSAKRMDTGHLSIALPFRTGAERQLKNNRRQALQRLQSLSRKFDRNSQFQQDYIAFVNKMIDAGHVERVENDNKDQDVNYIPHHGVYHPQKQKIRVVFNCASRFNGVSLNDCLLSGPDLTNSIVGVLCRFRQFQVPFAADVEAMFYQVFVPESQRDLLRFLWWEGGRPSSNVITLRMKVHLFGATSSPSVANFALRRTAEKAGKAARDTVWHNFYVDDCLKSVDTEDEAIATARSLINACAEGGFNLTKFVSSSIKLLRSLDNSRLAKEIEELRLDEDKDDPLGSLQERALGVVWNVKEDTLGFRVKPNQIHCGLTKRSILSNISQVYDPLGMAAPVTIVARARFRDLTRGDLAWDEPLLDEDAQRWRNWLISLEELKTTSIRRWIGLESQGSRYQLHVFCDASTEAYAAVAFIRKGPQTPDEEAEVSFLYGKARVSPPKVVTIPRLELTAAKLAAEVVSMLKDELEVKIESSVLWTDSQTVLKYLSNKGKRFHVFVGNKVESILSKTSVKEWRYVPTYLNPADDATRGLKAEKLKSSNWLNGPEFLRGSEIDWPKTEFERTLAPEDPEVKPDKAVKEVVNWIQGQEMDEEEPFIEVLARRYSSVLRFNRALAIWLRLRTYLQKRSAAPSSGIDLHTLRMQHGAFQSEELRKAQRAGIVWLQRERWSKELNDLKKGNRASAWLRALTPGLQGEMLVTRTRTGIQLPIVPEGILAKLLISAAHTKEGHSGKQATAAEIRRSFWIIRLSKMIKEIIRTCPWCQRRKATPGATQMSDLPEMRMTPGPPFQTTGVDFFGPFKARSTTASAPRTVYGIVFTCAVSRAVHLELAEGLDISNFINALRRFCSRRGLVRTLVCDNASNFTGTRDALFKELMEVVKAHRNDPLVIDSLRKKNVEWQFIPPESPHFGGFYERLIRCIKNVLNVLMNAAGGTRAGPLTADLLITLLCECEYILNERPLTPVSDDPADFEALTPNHLLLGRSECSTPSPGGAVLPGDYSILSKALRFRWRLVQHLTAEFWTRWNKEYKTLLFQRSKWFERNIRPLRIGDAVLVKDSSRKIKELGKLGRIVDIFPSKDGDIRVANVLTAKGTYTRPITKLCLLEAASEVSTDRN